MNGGPENDKRCPVCGGRMSTGLATVPFVLAETVIVIKHVPAEICQNCHEPFIAGKVTDRVTDLLNQLRTLQTEVSIVSFGEPQTASHQ